MEKPGAEQFTEPQTRYFVPRNGSNYLASWTGGKWPWLVGLKPRARERVLVTTDPAALRPRAPFSPYAKLTRQTFAWIRKWADPWIVHLYLRSGHRLLDRAIMDLTHASRMDGGRVRWLSLIEKWLSRGEKLSAISIFLETLGGEFNQFMDIRDRIEIDSRIKGIFF